MKLARSSGILLHPTSLPGRFGIGDLGPEAYRFVDFLAGADQAFWQMMPLGPSGLGDSPYSSHSAFAGNPNLISPEEFVAEGLLAGSDLLDAPDFPSDRVDYGKVIGYKRRLLEKAFRAFQSRLEGDAAERRAYARALEPASSWLDDYALFSALHDEHGGSGWQSWDAGLARRDPGALASARQSLGDRVEAHRFYQYAFTRQWARLKTYANQRGVRIIGDIPMFVAHNSADVWARPDLFQLDARGTPTVVAGVPPDAFSATGQLWGNPLYDWRRMRADGFGWWIDRVRRALHLVDVVRLDHFRGFAACWEVPAADTSAERGRWVPSAGLDLLKALEADLGDLPIIAEDLGTITPDVHRLRDALQLPGMRVLQFAFSGDPHDTHLPHEYPRRCVAYTGTHDNDTVVGWFSWRSRPGATATERAELHACLRYLGSDGSKINWDFIRAVAMSVADVAVVPLQDILGLGSEARMNTPAQPEGNWAWRFRADALTDALRQRVRETTVLYGRSAKR